MPKLFLTRILLAALSALVVPAALADTPAATPARPAEVRPLADFLVQMGGAQSGEKYLAMYDDLTPEAQPKVLRFHALCAAQPDDKLRWKGVVAFLYLQDLLAKGYARFEEYSRTGILPKNTPVNFHKYSDIALASCPSTAPLIDRAAIAALEKAIAQVIERDTAKLREENAQADARIAQADARIAQADARIAKLREENAQIQALIRALSR